ncbi:MAG TPA: hypothetical protein VNT60_11350 [Deinococcales bacterium]|nr:hypothetical protein [Deinococcales bacterium]
MNPNLPLKALKIETLRKMADDMNAVQAVAVALLPRFGMEIVISGNEFQVQVSELDTGHDIRLARDVAGGMREALNRLIEQIDKHLESQGIQPVSNNSDA